ncbi:MAG: hypothetical protein HA496_10915 [Thaumarchaeota archaeon]|nr:hypothetical protein [Nitrososphaerota archaeon]
MNVPGCFHMIFPRRMRNCKRRYLIFLNNVYSKDSHPCVKKDLLKALKFEENDIVRTITYLEGKDEWFIDGNFMSQITS